MYLRLNYTTSEKLYQVQASKLALLSSMIPEGEPLQVERLKYLRKKAQGKLQKIVVSFLFFDLKMARL
jgi:hypothetical protein